MARLPKKWTAEEDDTLRREVESQPSGPEGRDWCHIAEKLPGRTNKDCRKRWHNTMAGEFRKGLWAKQEDEQLKMAIAKHGTRWTVVASAVKTRSAEQCAKRWQHSLNPDLDRSEWTESEDHTLIEAVKAIGRQWTQIQRMYFAERSKNAIKNRYTIVSRKLRRKAQGTQCNESTAPEERSNDEDSDDDDDLGEDDGDSDKDESGPAWSSSPPSRSQGGGPSTTGMQNVLSDSSWNQFDPMLNGGHPSMYDVAPGSSSDPWTWESSQLLSSTSLMDTSSDPFLHSNDSTFLDLMMPDSGSGSTCSDTLAYPSTTRLDCSMPWKCPGELEGSCEDLIIPPGASGSTNTVAVKLTLDNPDSETMQSLMRIAIENKARFLVERQ